ncbi:hypothetical protein GCM10009753_71760 [Streptantibioticus ferralitis]
MYTPEGAKPGVHIDAARAYFPTMPSCCCQEQPQPSGIHERLLLIGSAQAPAPESNSFGQCGADRETIGSSKQQVPGSTCWIPEAFRGRWLASVHQRGDPGADLTSCEEGTFVPTDLQRHQAAQALGSLAIQSMLHVLMDSPPRALDNV